MSYNRQQSQSQQYRYLVQWLNSERRAKDKQHDLFNLQQIFQEQFISGMLADIDQELFRDFCQLSSDSKLQTLERYLDKEHGKRMKYCLKAALGTLTQYTHHIHLIKLICYMSIHSTSKNQYINRILSLPSQTQQYLMKQMQQMQQKLSNITEIKQILEHIEKVEEENQYLKEKLQQLTDINVKMLQYIKEYESDFRVVKDELEVLKKEKFQVFNHLKIGFLTDYTDAYTRLKQENDKSYATIQQLQIKIQRQSIKAQQLQTRIKFDCIVINNLSEQLSKLKNSGMQNNNSDEKYGSNKQVYQNVLGQSKKMNKQNINSLQSSLKGVQVIAQEQTQTNYRIYNQQLIQKLQSMYGKFAKVNNQMLIAKQCNSQLLVRNLQQDDRLNRLYKAQKSFEFKYKYFDNSDAKDLNQFYRQRMYKQL